MSTGSARLSLARPAASLERTMSSELGQRGGQPLEVCSAPLRRDVDVRGPRQPLDLVKLDSEPADDHEPHPMLMQHGNDGCSRLVGEWFRISFSHWQPPSGSAACPRIASS
jgi:hypothetical protein